MPGPGPRGPFRAPGSDHHPAPTPTRASISPQALPQSPQKRPSCCCLRSSGHAGPPLPGAGAAGPECILTPDSRGLLSCLPPLREVTQVPGAGPRKRPGPAGTSLPWGSQARVLPLSRQAPSCCQSLGRKPWLLGSPRRLRLPPAEKSALKDPGSLEQRQDAESGLGWVPRAGQRLPGPALRTQRSSFPGQYWPLQVKARQQPQRRSPVIPGGLN